MGHDDISKDKNAIHYKLSNKFELNWLHFNIHLLCTHFSSSQLQFITNDQQLF
jgi:hypothetical protein